LSAVTQRGEKEAYAVGGAAGGLDAGLGEGGGNVEGGAGGQGGVEIGQLCTNERNKQNEREEETRDRAVR
jgi:hypothetical protein